MRPETVEMISPLPFALRQRVGGYLDYVYDQLLDLLLDAQRTDLLPAVVADVETFFTLRYLHRLVVIGFENYSGTLEFFRTKQIDGYRIGSTEYTASSDFTRSWQELADLIVGLSEDPVIRALVVSQDSVRTTLRRFLYEYWEVDL